MELEENLFTGRVLVIDDDEMTQRLLKSILENAGNEVALAPRPQDTMDLIESFQPDAILLDLVMPEVDGFQLCKIIRARYSNLPILMITGIHDPDACTKTVAAGANDYLTKPLQAGNVLIRVKNALQTRHLEMMLEAQRLRSAQVESQLNAFSSELDECADHLGVHEAREKAAEFLAEFNDQDDDIYTENVEMAS
ncbi:MAG: response regulator [Verrucomicrobiota bacterium]